MSQSNKCHTRGVYTPHFCYNRIVQPTKDMTDDIKEEKKKKKLTDKDPLTLEEIKAACDMFFPLFNAVKAQLPEDAELKDQIKIMESVAQIAVLLRKNNNKETGDDAEFIFGFNKANKKEEETTDE